jgi:hypothetical protein
VAKNSKGLRRALMQEKRHCSSFFRTSYQLKPTILASPFDTFAILSACVRPLRAQALSNSASRIGVHRKNGVAKSGAASSLQPFGIISLQREKRLVTFSPFWQFPGGNPSLYSSRPIALSKKADRPRFEQRFVPRLSL